MQLAVITMAVLVGRERVQAAVLGARLTRLASSLPTSPPAGALADALRNAVGDPSVQLNYWASARDSYVDSEGTVQVPPVPSAESRLTLVTRGGERIAAINHAASTNSDRLDRALGPAMRLALQNDQLRAATLAELRELQLSRTRILERAALERRRLERNLHDGAQQRVVSLALLLRMLRSAVQTRPAAELAARAGDLTEVILSQLRELARGIYPAVLADAGLRGALEDMAESSTDLAIEVSAAAASALPHRGGDSRLSGGGGRYRRCPPPARRFVDHLSRRSRRRAGLGSSRRRRSESSLYASLGATDQCAWRGTGDQLQGGRGMGKARAAMRVVIADDAKLIRSGWPLCSGRRASRPWVKRARRMNCSDW